MQAFLQHQLQRAKAGLITNALDDCHVTGLASIVFYDGPMHRLRMFVAQRHHHLWWNEPTRTAGSWTHFAEAMSLGLHGHHCELTLQQLTGPVMNVTATADITTPGEFLRYRLDSKINGGSGRLVVADPRPVSMRFIRVEPMQVVTMGAHQLHTVTVERNRFAAWLVMEGPESLSPPELVYTNNPQFEASELYRPMARDEIVQCIETVLQQIAKSIRRRNALRQ